MATGMQPEPAFALSTTPRPCNGETVDSNICRDNNVEVITVTGIGRSSSRRNFMGDSSSKVSLVDSTKYDFDFLWSLRKYLVLLGILAVGVTYNSGLTPPGGFWNNNQDDHKAGDPTLPVEFSQRYKVFFYCNATAFAASLVLIILLLSKSVTREKLWLRSMQFSMIVDLFSLMGAYAAGSCRALKSSLYIWVLVFVVFGYVWIHILVSTRFFSKTLKKKVKGAVTHVLSKFGIYEGHDHQGKTDLEEARKFILTLVTFSATVTYQAGLSPPGGFWAENGYRQRPATSILRSHYRRRYNIFVGFNSTSFVASLVSIMLLLSPELSRHGIIKVKSSADLFCLVGAYAAGCCRDVATSFYVMFIIFIVLICIALLFVIIVYKPVAEWLQTMKSGNVRCLSALLSSKFSSARLTNAEEGSHASYQQPSVPFPSESAEGSALQPEHQHKCNQQVPVNSDLEGELRGECPPPPADEEIAINTEGLSNCCHPSESTNTKNSLSDQENQSGDCKLVANTTEVRSSKEHPSLSCQEQVNIRAHIFIDNQNVASMKEQSSTDDITTEGFADHNGTTKDLKLDEGISLPAEDVDCAEENTLVVYNHEVEIVTIANDPQHSGNDHIDSSQGAVDQNAHGNQIERHLKKTRTCLLLLAILAASLTYQSGLNPPAGDRILEDNDHARFIAFFYLNAVAFVASLVMILMLLNKSMIEKVTKRRELQIAMIVVLLSLSGSFVMGSCREAKKSIYISVLLCLVLLYVGVHVLIAIHVIPLKCKKVVSANLMQFFSALPRLLQKKTVNLTSDKDLDQGRKLKELDQSRKLLLTLAILAATVTYQAGISPPGGVWSDNNDKRGHPVLQDNHPERYDVFYYSNSVSFVSSVATTILLVNKESCEHGIKSYALRVCLVAGLLGLLTAYAAGSCRNWKETIFLIIIAGAVLISLVIQALLSSMHDTLGRPLAKYIGFIYEWVFRPEKMELEIISKSSETSDCEEKEERKRHKYLMLIAVLAASITYQAGLNPPGGFWSYDDRKEGHVAGNPVLHDIHHERYKTFFCFNAISFMASIVRKKGVPLDVLLLIMILDLLALMTTFAAGSCRKFWTSVYVFALVAAVLIYLVILIILSRRIEKCLRKWKIKGYFFSRHPEAQRQPIGMEFFYIVKYVYQVLECLGELQDTAQSQRVTPAHGAGRARLRRAPRTPAPRSPYAPCRRCAGRLVGVRPDELERVGKAASSSLSSTAVHMTASAVKLLGKKTYLRMPSSRSQKSTAPARQARPGVGDVAEQGAEVRGGASDAFEESGKLIYALPTQYFAFASLDTISNSAAASPSPASARRSLASALAAPTLAATLRRAVPHCSPASALASFDACPPRLPALRHASLRRATRAPPCATARRVGHTAASPRRVARAAPVSAAPIRVASAAPTRDARATPPRPSAPTPAVPVRKSRETGKSTGRSISKGAPRQRWLAAEEMPNPATTGMENGL
ncbi:hypothetical protein EJB05_45190, partial [Eragrostis curvula]